MSDSWKTWQGQVVDGKFYLGQYLGGSSHSAVFLTERQDNPRKAAIKLIPADPGEAQLQLSRWEAVRKLSHPNLVRLFECGRCEISGIPVLYVVMEFANEDLSQVIPTRPLTTEETRDTLRPVIDALAYVHDHGLVHGHLKPSNIMAVQEQLKISSDGLSRSGERRPSSSRAGTEDPPEAETALLSTAQDMWSLGMTVVEVLTQSPPRREGMVPGEPLLPQSLTPPFSEIARNCLRREPVSRWTLAQINMRLQPRHPAPAPHPPAKKSLNPRPWLMPAAGLIVAVGLVAGGVKLFHRPEMAPQAAPAVAAEPSPQPSPARPPVSSPPVTQNSQPSAPAAKSLPATLPAATPAAALEQAPPKPKPSALKPGSGRPAGMQVQDVIPASQSVPVPAASTAPASSEPEPMNLGTIVHVEKPTVPPSASNTIQGTIRVIVKVNVDPSGNVTGAALDSPGPSKYFANLSVQAARGWKFAPTPENPGAPQAWTIRFEYQQAGVHAYASKANP